MDNKYIDMILSEIAEQDDYVLKEESAFNNRSEFIKYWGTIGFMINENLIYKVWTNTDKIRLTSHGIRVRNDGGYVEFLMKEAVKNKREDRKLKFDLLNAEWLNKTRWLPYVISTISLIVSAVVLFQSCE